MVMKGEMVRNIMYKIIRQRLVEVRDEMRGVIGLINWCMILSWLKRQWWYVFNRDRCHGQDKDGALYTWIWILW
jgi:hypothetical protein